MVAVLDVPSHNMSINSGDMIKVSRFSDINWIVSYGWYTYANTTICGWYLMRCDAPGTIKPLEASDFDDIVIVRSVYGY